MKSAKTTKGRRGISLIIEALSELTLERRVELLEAILANCRNDLAADRKAEKAARHNKAAEAAWRKKHERMGLKRV